MFKDWREQHNRILRTFRRVKSGDLNDSETQDDLVHLFQDIFHLKDWLIESGRLRREDVQDAIDNLKICRALVIKAKHFRVDLKRRHNDLDPNIVEQRISSISASALIVDGTPIPMPSTAQPPIRPETRPPTVSSIRPSKITDFIIKTPASHPCFKGKEFSCLEVIEHAIQDWETLLKKHGLLTGRRRMNVSREETS